MFFLSSDISQGWQQWNKTITIRYYRSPKGHPSIFSMKNSKKNRKKMLPIYDESLKKLIKTIYDKGADMWLTG